jgi:hypothetical protein
MRAGGVAQVVDCLPRIYEALSSNPSTAKNNNKRLLNIWYEAVLSKQRWENIFNVQLASALF